MTDYFDQEARTWDENAYRIERARAVAQGIRESAPTGGDVAALEYGCGTGLVSFALQPHLGHITLADNSSGMLAVVEEKIAAGNFNNMTALKLDLSAEAVPGLRVQLVYTLMTLHHIADVAKVLRGFYDLLASPGYLCVADLDKEDGSFHGAGFDGHNGFAREAFGRLVEAAGFRSPAFRTIFQTPKVLGEVTRYYPVFLMTAGKR